MHKIVSLLCITILVSCNSVGKSESIAQQVTVPKHYDKVDVLPNAVLYDTTLELDFIKTANERGAEFIVAEVIITSKRWALTFNEYGQIVARSRSASMIANKEDKCYVQNLVFEQKGDGESFNETEIVKKSNWKTFNCNVLENKNPDTIARVQFEN
ncbi:hypothetical protein ACFSQJ_09315 [Croceitalea marina]|uniref:Lipoprotein n=1 Tax=Croceitalea marina TaxID=1775166 RepID=A0ABW5MWK3_9FLAO